MPAPSLATALSHFVSDVARDTCHSLRGWQSHYCDRLDPGFIDYLAQRRVLHVSVKDDDMYEPHLESSRQDSSINGE
jgi:hypothetical protein